MPHHLVGVGLTAAVFVVTATACSRASDPVAASRNVVADASTGVIAQGVHVSVLKGMVGPRWQATAMNDWGEIVGQYTNGQTFPGPGFPFKWQSSRGFSVDSVHFRNGNTCTTAAVNDRGEMALNCDKPYLEDWFDNVRALRLLSTWTPPDTGQAGFSLPYCTLYGLNNNGVAVGICFIADLGPIYATVWTAYGTPDALFPQGSRAAITGGAFGIANTGSIVGIDTAAHAGFVFDPDHRVHYLPPMNNSSAVHLNDSAWATGTIPTTREVVAWIHDSIVHTGMVGLAIGISNSGEVIGETDTQGGFVWTRGTGARFLPGINGVAHGAVVAINNTHQILGLVGYQYVLYTLPPS